MSIKELDNVLFRLSMVKDEAMGGVVNKLLPRLLLQLTPTVWSNVTIRNKFVQILTHLHKRLTSLTTVQVPIAEVLELFTGQKRFQKMMGNEVDSLSTSEEEDMDEDEDEDVKEDSKSSSATSSSSSSSPSTTTSTTSTVPTPNAIRSNFAQLFLELGFSRLSGDDQIKMLPALVNGLTAVNTNQNHRAIILRLSVGALTYLSMSTDVSIRREQLSFILDAPASARSQLISFWKEVLLFRHAPTIQNSKPATTSEYKVGETVYYIPTADPVKVLSIHTDDPAALYVTVLMPGGREKQTISTRLSTTFIPPGMSSTGVIRVCGNAGNNKPRPPPSLTVLNSWKVSILKVLRTEELGFDVLPHLVIGTCDSNHDVREIAVEYVKRVGTQGRKDLEEKNVIQSLLSLFVGGNGGGGNNILPASWQLRGKILEQLLHSRIVCDMAPWCVKLIFESLFGPGTTSKVQCAGCEFAKKFIESSDNKTFTPVKGLVMQALSKMLRQALEMLDAGGSNTNVVVRLTSMSSAGLVALALKAPGLFGTNLELPNMMFGLLVSGENELRASAQEALSSLVDAYVKSSPENILSQLRTQLLERATQDDYRVRLCALTWLSRLYPFDDPAVRFTCIELSSDSRQEVRQLAKYGLKVINHSNIGRTTPKSKLLLSSNNNQYKKGDPPKISTMIRYLMTKANLQSSTTRAKSLDAVSLTHALEFIQQILIYEVEKEQKSISKNAGEKKESECDDDDDEMKVFDDESVESLSNIPKESILQCADLVSLAIGSDVSQAGATTLLRTAASSLAKLIELFPNTVGQRYASKENVSRLEIWLSEPNQDLREGASRVLLLVSKWIDVPQLRELLERMLSITLDSVDRSPHINKNGGSSSPPKQRLAGTSITSVSKLNALHGAILGSAHILAGVSSCRDHLTTEQRERIVTMLLRHSGEDEKGSSKDDKDKKVGKLHWAAKDPAVRSACCECLGLVGRENMLRDEQQADVVISALVRMSKNGSTNSANSSSSSGSSSSSDSSSSKTDDSSTTDVAYSSKSSSIVEGAVVSIGQICKEYQSTRERACEEMIKIAIHDRSSVDVHFACGETLAKVGLAATITTTTATPDFSTTNDELEKEKGETPDSKRQKLADGTNLMGRLLTRTFELLDDARPKVRAAASVMFLSFVKHAPKHVDVQSRLYDIQAACTRLLGERSEFVQEVAGKTMSFVYEVADERQRKVLLGSLSRTLSTGKRKNIKESKVDAFGSTGGPAGAQLSNAGNESYNQMCQAANDMGNPELVYKFLSFASHHSAWHSRRGAAFGITEMIGEGAIEQLRPQFPKMLPRLYRARFDPDPKTSGAMTRLWKALCGGEEGGNITDESKLIREYFTPILEGTLPALTSRHWRDRLSACLALDDLLLIGRVASEVMPSIEKLWDSSLKMADDIKEPVQKGGLRLVRTLGKLTIRLADPTMTSHMEAAQTLSIVLPFFLNKGCVDACSKTRALSMYFMLKVVKVAGPLLVPHASDVVPVLLEYLSALESSDLVYLQQHTDKMKNITAEQLEEIRLRMASAGPLAEAMNLCLERCCVSNEAIDKLAPSLVALVQRGTGLATRAMSARVIVRLATSCPKLLKSHADSMLRPLSNGLTDRSVTVRKEFGKAIGQVARLCKKRSVTRLVERLLNDYTESDPSDEKTRHAAGVALMALVTTAPSKLKKCVSQLIPISFIAKFSNEQAVKDIWESVWNEITVTTQQGIKLHLKEVITTVLSVLGAGSHDLRRQGADALTEVLKSVEAKDFQDTDLVDQIESSMVSALTGRFWAGKDAVLKATVALATLCPTKMIEKIPKLVERFMRECGRERESVVYSRESVTQLGLLLNAAPSVDAYRTVEPMLTTFIETKGPVEKKKEGDNDEDGECKINSSVKADPVMHARAIECLGCAFPDPCASTASTTQMTVIKSITTLLGTSIGASVWRVRVAIAASAGKVLVKLVPSCAGTNSEYVKELMRCLRVAADDIKFHQVRHSAITSLHNFVKRASNDKKVAEMCKQCVPEMKIIIRLLRNDTDPETAHKAGLTALVLDQIEK